MTHREEAPDRKARMADLSAARRTSLAGRSPHQVGQEKERAVLDWTYKWTWTSPSVAAIIGRDNQNGLAARLVRQGLLKKTRTESGGGQPGIPAYMLTLTREGVSRVERHLESQDQLLKYNPDPYRLNQSLLRHDILAQTTTAKALRDGSITEYLTLAQFRTAGRSGVKEPDVMWKTKLGDWIAVEIELSAKWGRDLDQFVDSYISGLGRTLQGKPRFSNLAIITDSKAILERYQKAFKPGAEYGDWDFDKHSKQWKSDFKLAVPEWVNAKILWKLLDHS
jgi:hypothetical protein